MFITCQGALLGMLTSSFPNMDLFSLQKYFIRVFSHLILCNFESIID